MFLVEYYINFSIFTIACYVYKTNGKDTFVVYVD